MTTPIVPSITDEQLAELEFQFQGVQKNGGAVLLSGEWLGGLIARLRDAEKDAARYRWLRNPDQDVALIIDKQTASVPVDKFGGGGYGIYEYRAGEELDQAIDTAMEQQP